MDFLYQEESVLKDVVKGSEYFYHVMMETLLVAMDAQVIAVLKLDGLVLEDLQTPQTDVLT